MAYTFNPTQYSTVEVLQDGNRISTVTPELATSQYGYGGDVTAGANFNPNYEMQKVQPVASLSSVAGQNVVNNNTKSLQKIESAYVGPSIVDFLNSAGRPSDINSRAGLAKEYGVGYDVGATGEKSAAQNTALLQSLRNVSGSPVSQTMVSDINKAVSTGGLTAGEKQGLSGLQTTQDDVAEAAANARASLEAGKYTEMDYWTKKAEADRLRYEKELSDYYKSTSSLRQRATELLTPGDREKQLGQQLTDIRTQVEQFNIQTEEDKFREFEGQTLGFAGGRASEIDIRAEFKRQRMASSEKNLLLSLGLEQDARKMEGEAIDKQLTYLSDDYDLQNKVQEKISASEEKVFERADALRKEAKDTLVSLLDQLEGIDPSTMSPETVKQLEEFSARAGLPFDLVRDALKTQHDKRVFEESIKRSKEGGIALTADDRRSLVGAGFSTDEVSSIENDIKSYGMDKVLESPGLTESQKNVIRKVYGAEKKVTLDQLQTTVTLKMAQDGLKETYTTDELIQLAKDNGFASLFKGSETEVEDFLESDKAKELYTQLLYKQYQDAGLAE